MKSSILPEDIHFHHMQFPKTQNYFCLAPEGMFEFLTKPESPIFDCSVAELVKAWKKMIACQSRIKRRSESEAKHRYHYICKTWLIGLPSYLIIQFFPVTDVQSTLLMYSYSMYPLPDFGVNQARVLGYLIKLKKSL